MVFVLVACSHNALLLEDGKLFTSELTSGGARRLEYYMSLPVLKALFAVGLQGIWRAFALLAFAIALCVAVVVIRKQRT